jgi:hypothetical protein
MSVLKIIAGKILAGLRWGVLAVATGMTYLSTAIEKLRSKLQG